MKNLPSDSRFDGRHCFAANQPNAKTLAHTHPFWRGLTLLVFFALFAQISFAQGSPKVTSVDPAAGKTNDTVSVIGENLGKGSVAAVFLSDDKNDTKATVMEQGDGKIIIKVPSVKAGSYNISIQAGDKIMILPVRFEVQN